MNHLRNSQFLINFQQTQRERERVRGSNFSTDSRPNKPIWCSHKGNTVVRGMKLSPFSLTERHCFSEAHIALYSCILNCWIQTGFAGIEAPPGHVGKGKKIREDSLEAADLQKIYCPILSEKNSYNAALVEINATVTFTTK